MKDTKDIKVIYVIDSLVRGGKERRLMELLNGFNEKSTVRVMVILLKNLIHYPEIYKLPNVEVKVLKRKIKKDPEVFFKIFMLCKQFRPNIIHTWGSMPSMYALPVSKLLNIKFVNGMITNSFYKPWTKNWKRAKLTFLFSNVILSNSFTGSKAYKVPDNKARIIHNGFDFNRISNLKLKKEIRNKFNIKTKYIIGMVGSFYYNKDYYTYINAAMKMLQINTDLTFLCIGDGPELDYFKDLVRPQFRNNVLLLGRQENIESIVNVFDIGVLLTNDNRAKEGISNSIMEYMALGKPVIASKGGGTAEIVVDGETGLLIDPSSKDQLIESIEYLVNNPIVAKKMGNSGKERILNHFNINKMVSKTLDLYQELLNK